MKLFTIGFTQTTAEHFFSRLTRAGVRKIIDARLNREGQLAGFAKAQDLQFFLERLASIKYVAEPLLAPSAEALQMYRNKKMSWEEYAAEYLRLIQARGIETTLEQTGLDESCLLCSEPKPDRCHRRLAAEYLKNCSNGSGFEVIHL
jgi:uncharacterized protein (DUF488 family)